MKILKQAALLLLVSTGAAFALHECRIQLNLHALRQAIPKHEMIQLERNRENLEAYKDCLDREQELTHMVWTQNQNETIARRAAKASKLNEEYKAQTERLNAEKSEITGNMRPMTAR